MSTYLLDTTLGILEATLSDAGGLRSLIFPVGRKPAGEPIGGPHASSLRKLVMQLDEYVTGRRATFELPMPLDAASGTDFDRRVWGAACAIPAGETRTYGQLASSLGSPGAARAVGASLGRNPIMLLVPCHRVIGHDGSLTGYAGGIDLKKRLLDIESSYALPTSPRLFELSRRNIDVYTRRDTTVVYWQATHGINGPQGLTTDRAGERQDRQVVMPMRADCQWRYPRRRNSRTLLPLPTYNLPDYQPLRLLARWLSMYFRQRRIPPTLTQPHGFEKERRAASGVCTPRTKDLDPFTGAKR